MNLNSRLIYHQIDGQFRRMRSKENTSSCAVTGIFKLLTHNFIKMNLKLSWLMKQWCGELKENCGFQKYQITDRKSVLEQRTSFFKSKFLLKIPTWLIINLLGIFRISSLWFKKTITTVKLAIIPTEAMIHWSIIMTSNLLSFWTEKVS